MDLNLDLNLAPPVGNRDQEETSSVESNETSQQALGEGVGANVGNAPSLSGHHPNYLQFLAEQHQVYQTGQPPQPAPSSINGVYQTGQSPQLAPARIYGVYQTGQPPQLAPTSIDGVYGVYQTGQPPQPATTSIDGVYGVYQTGQPPQPASTSIDGVYGVYQTGQPPQPAPTRTYGVYQTGQPQPAPIRIDGVPQIDPPPQPVPTGRDGVQQTGQPPVDIQNEVRDQINSGRNDRNSKEVKLEQRATEQNNPDKRPRVSYDVSFKNRGGIRDAKININSSTRRH